MDDDVNAASDPLLAALDDDQRVVAEALIGPVCVLAGAGTGKTRAITHRIAYGVASGAYDPARVMALTFTSRAAAELRAREHADRADERLGDHALVVVERGEQRVV